MSNRTLQQVLQILEDTEQIGWGSTFVGKGYSKQHLIDDLRAINQQQPSGTWYDWLGDDTNTPPVPTGTLVQLQYRDGSFYTGRVMCQGEGAMVWSHDGDPYDIVRYQVL